jgi:Flp pilus assembly protein TadG
MGSEAMIQRTGHFRGRRRRAAAVVEMAVVTPLLLTLLFGIIEYGWLFMIKQTMTNAAREGCRVATLQGSTDGQITGTITSYLTGTGLAGADYTVTLTHATPGNPTETVVVTVPYRNVSLLGGFFGSTDWSLGSTCSMRKEGM